MANPDGNPGNSGGKSLQDRKLAAEVRILALGKIKIILQRPAVEMNEKDKELHDAILLKLAGTVLPRLNEHSGPDGGEIPIPLLGGQSNGKNNLGDQKTTTTAKAD